jgi:hypothetical protein
MLVVDDRSVKSGRPNVQLGLDASVGEIRQYISRILATPLADLGEPDAGTGSSET